MNKFLSILSGILVTILSAATIILAILLSQYVQKTGASEARVDKIYEQNYYAVNDSLKNVETKLAKVNAVSGEAVRREVLADVWKECDGAVSGLALLGRDGEETENLTKFLNQVGDYAYYLMGKTAAGQRLTQAEKENVRTFKTLVGKLREELAAVGDTMTAGEKISAKTLSDMSAVGNAIKAYSSVDYPELIYDGPFSDGLNDREAKYLKGKAAITAEQATEIISILFDGATNVTAQGEGAGSIPTYVVSFRYRDLDYCAFVTKAGGYVASLNAYGETNDPTVTEAECVEKAKAFLAQTGYANMRDVWVYNNDSTVYINFAFEENDVVFYPDLVKVKVSANDGSVLGMEATNYLYNHGTREIDYDNGAESAITLADGFSVTGTRYCVIPTEWNEEVYCKEIKGTLESMTYYLYFDLSTGEEIRAMVVVDENGDKLI